MRDMTNTLRDAQRLFIEKNLAIVDSALAQYIKSAIEFVERKGEKLEDYALIKVDNPMQLKDDNTVVISGQWRLIHTSELENVPDYD